MAAEAGPSNAVVAAEPDVDLTVHPSGIVPQLQVRRRVQEGMEAAAVGGGERR